MSGIDKLVERLRSIPSDFTFSEAERLLKSLGFERDNKGKTSGSRVRFQRKSDGFSILLHKPHPGDQMMRSAVRDLYQKLYERGDV